MQELGCALQAGAWPIVLIVNNRSYGTIRMHQERTYPGRVSFTDIVNPDFVALGRRLRHSRRARDRAPPTFPPPSTARAGEPRPARCSSSSSTPRA